ncbi:MAG: SdpI family protein, partial [Anaerolineae bacterium]
DIPFIPLMIVTIGLGLAYAANLFTRLEPNWFIGIRFPWTVNNRAVWKRTHRVGGRIMLVGGLLTAAAGLLLPQETAGVVALIALGGGTLYLVVWSFSLSRRFSANSR